METRRVTGEPLEVSAIRRDRDDRPPPGRRAPLQPSPAPRSGVRNNEPTPRSVAPRSVARGKPDREPARRQSRVEPPQGYAMYHDFTWRDGTSQHGGTG